MLGRTTTVKESLKRVVRFVVVLFAVNALLVIAQLILFPDYEITFPAFLRGVLKGNLGYAGSFWYLYAYIGYLLMLPFLQRAAQGITKSEIYLLVALHFVISSLIPIINIFFSMRGVEGIWLDSHFQIPLAVEKAFFYPLIGYYIDKKVGDIKNKECIGLISIAAVGIIFSCLATYWEGTTTGTYTQNYVQLFDYVTTIVAFLLLKKMFCECKWSWIPVIGSLTFGIYLFDAVLKIEYSKYSSVLEPILPTMIVSIIWVLLSMTIGGVATFVLKKIPGVGKFV